jgi:hypothetical protein
MRKKIALVAATVLALAASMTSSAIASDLSHKAKYARHYHGNAMRAAGGQEGRNTYGDSGYKSLGPLGIQFPCVPHGYCGQGYSVSAWSY